MLVKLKEIFENENITENTSLDELSMDSITKLSIYLLFQDNEKEIKFSDIDNFITVGDIIKKYESK